MLAGPGTPPDNIIDGFTVSDVEHLNLHFLLATASLLRRTFGFIVLQPPRFVSGAAQTHCDCGGPTGDGSAATMFFPLKSGKNP